MTLGVGFEGAWGAVPPWLVSELSTGKRENRSRVVIYSLGLER
jgi:hypothetical protein